MTEGNASAAKRLALQAASMLAQLEVDDASRRVNEDTLAKLKAEGMQVVPPSSQLKADMAKVGDTMLKEWLDKAGPDGKALIDAYRK